MTRTVLNLMVEILLANNSSTNPNSSPSSYYLFELEIVLLTLSVVTATMFGIVLWQTKTFHRNVRVLFLSLVLSAYGYAISRYYYLSNDFSHGTLNRIFPCIASIVMFTDTLFGIMFTINQLGVVTERIIATKYSYSYENQGYFSTFLVFIIPWVVNITTRALAFYNIVNSMFLTFLMMVCNLVTWTCLIILYFINKRSFKMGFISNLSEKYQIVENIRIVRVLIVFVCLTACRNMINITFLLLRGYYSDPNHMYQLSTMFDHGLRMVLSLYILLYPFPLIYSHKDLKRKFKEIIFRIKRKTSAENKEPKNVLGEQIIMKNTGEDYFKNLAVEWAKEIETKRPQRSFAIKSNRVSDANTLPNSI